MLDTITPILLTYNEIDNIERTLAHLQWANQVLVVDSGSTDGTLAILEAHPKVSVQHRAFSGFADQWNYALGLLQTEWALKLDADLLVTESLQAELAQLQPTAAVGAYRIPRRFCIDGIPLHCSILTPIEALLRKNACNVQQNGHAEQITVSGTTQLLNEELLHDDRKPITRWAQSQIGYAKSEAAKIRSSAWKDLDSADRVRKVPLLAPFAMLFILVLRGCFFDGRRGIQYLAQRVHAELLLSIFLLSSDSDADSAEQ